MTICLLALNLSNEKIYTKLKQDIYTLLAKNSVYTALLTLEKWYFYRVLFVCSFYWEKNCSSYSHFPACVCICVLWCKAKQKHKNMCSLCDSAIVVTRLLTNSCTSSTLGTSTGSSPHTYTKQNKKITTQSPFKFQKPWCQTCEVNEEFLSSASKEQEESLLSSAREWNETFFCCFFSLYVVESQNTRTLAIKSRHDTRGTMVLEVKKETTKEEVVPLRFKKTSAQNAQTTRFMQKQEKDVVIMW